MSSPHRLVLYILVVSCVASVTGKRYLLRRDKRAPTIWGLKAWRSILKNSQKVSITGTDGVLLQSSYVRKGGYLKALGDFYAIRPENVKYLQGNDMDFKQIGIIRSSDGERTVMLQGRVDNGVPIYPTLRVFKTNKDGSDDAEQIVTYVN